MSDCIFCKIANKEIPAEVVDENEDIIAFKDVNPQAPVHVLVIPKMHISSFIEVREEHAKLMMKLTQSIQNISKKLEISESGFRVVVNNGSDAGQAVPHLHFHVLGGRLLKWPPG